MGADFVCGVLAIRRGHTPNWEAASKRIDEISDDEVKQIVDEYTNYFEKTDVESARTLIDEAYVTVKDGWECGNRMFTIFDHEPLDATFLITGDRTFGDPVREMLYMFLFEVTGCAKAAGFMV